jgi:DNA-binding NarL/FixJ family response regulator
MGLRAGTEPGHGLSIIMAAMSKILVIEDENKMRRNLVTILQLEGFEVIGAENGLSGLQMAESQGPDLILCDVMMPDIDGYAVLEQVRSNPKTTDIPLIFLTARGEKTDLRHGMNLGADDFLCKPCPTEELLEAVRARLKRQKERATSANSAIDFSSTQPLVKMGLTPREADVLLWMTQGKTNAEIATILALSDKTVKIHVGHIFEKLGVENRTAAALQALEVLRKK